MTLTEEELRQHLEAAAGQASPPRFAVGDLTGRIRRRRRRIIAGASACLAAVAALAVALPIGLAGGISPGAGRSVPAPLIKVVHFTVSVNGQRLTPRHTLSRGFAVSPGERLSIEVTATIPRRAKLTGIWIGIPSGGIGAGRTGPIGLRPILEHLRTRLQPGRHTFELTWTVPHQLGHARILWLAAVSAGLWPEIGPARSHQLAQAGIAQYIAKLVVR